jgi:hypothetical protein
MTHFLRHFTVRLWISLLTGCLVVLLGFPVVGGALGVTVAFWAVLACFLICFFVGGWFGNTLGMRWVERLMREAGIWERAGNLRQSEIVFKKAVSIFDSFLISPLVRHEKSRQLSARMARFYLSRQDTVQTANPFIMAYLHRYPDDVEVSDAWLQKADLALLCLREDDDLAFKMGEAQPENKGLQRMLAHACLLAERSDYPALKTYLRIIQDPGADDREIIDEIASRFFRDRRTDRWALQAYLFAFKANRKKTWLLKGMAACTQRASASDRASRHYMEAGKLLSRLDKETLAKLKQGFATPAPQRAKPAVPPQKAYLKTFWQSLATAVSALSTTVFASISTMGNAGAAFYEQVKHHKNTRVILNWTALGLAGTGLVVLMINTAVHLIPSKEAPPREPAPLQPAEIVVTDPFTLQVAAYLKVEHAEKFVATLKSQGLDAYYTEAKSTKSHWFQVRISHFPTKDDARAHGEALKTKGIIDDFYVANYRRP